MASKNWGKSRDAGIEVKVQEPEADIKPIEEVVKKTKKKKKKSKSQKTQLNEDGGK